jgi:hypothetical protein
LECGDSFAAFVPLFLSQDAALEAQDARQEKQKRRKHRRTPNQTTGVTGTIKPWKIREEFGTQAAWRKDGSAR